jgi:hypothetical protein
MQRDHDSWCSVVAQHYGPMQAVVLCTLLLMLSIRTHAVCEQSASPGRTLSMFLQFGYLSARCEVVRVSVCNVLLSWRAMLACSD